MQQSTLDAASIFSHNNAGSRRTDLELVGPFAFFAVAHAEVFNNRRIDLGGDALWPAGSIEEVACCQEVDNERRQVGIFFVISHTGEGKGLFSSTLELSATKLNLLLNVLTLGDCVEILNTDMCSFAHLTVFTIVRPVARIFAELFVGAPTGTLAFDAHDDGLTGVFIEELVNLFDHVSEVPGTGQSDGKHAVHKSKVITTGAYGNPDVKKPDAIPELLWNVHRLTSNRRQGGKACW
ncbi:hypothetical protein HG531_002395 [Fusarium graminearum]|nr:hypothetical protein HG531_002395 [Fusarium graminearum]